jgi:D-proline reductase (dithiol) PrdB
MGCARDIVEAAGVARYVWSDFPLGNSAGKPFDAASQRDTLCLALETFATANAPRTTVASPQRWSPDDDWQGDFMNVERLNAAAIERLRMEFIEQKRVAGELKQV